MPYLVPVTLFGWPFVVIALFMCMHPRRAVITAFLLGWLFLPVAGFDLPGFTMYTKVTATSMGALFGVALFDANRLLSFRFRWFDIPMAVWCLVPIASSVSNGLGLYDGVSEMVGQTVLWGIPYLIGRIYFTDYEGIRELAIGIFIGGLLYVPFCLYEIRMSPRLHNIIYGFHQHQFSQTQRFGGWRPMVFMQHGLAVAMWMVSASLVGVWLWVSGSLKRLGGIPMMALVPPLLVTTVLCKSTGALLLLVGAVGVLAACRAMRSPIPLICLALVAPVYIAARAPDAWDGSGLIAAIDFLPAERVSSIQTRLDSEDLIAGRAWERPLLGWGGWGRYIPEGAIPDGQWVIAFGRHGLVGLASFALVLALPPILVLWRQRLAQVDRLTFAPVMGLAATLAVYFIDQLFNAMANPLFIILIGSLLTLAPQLKRKPAQAAPLMSQPLPGVADK